MKNEELTPHVVCVVFFIPHFAFFIRAYGLVSVSSQRLLTVTLG